MNAQLKEIQKVEILTLQDNFVDLTSMDNSAVVQRAMPVKDGEIKNSLLAEHGFAARLTVVDDDQPRSILFDFGFSEHGAAYNVDALGIDLSTIEAMVLSHGHMDHFGGLEAMVARVGRKGVDLVLHPTAFRRPRYLKMPDGNQIHLPPLRREKIQAAGVNLVESRQPRLLLDGRLLFLGEIPKKTSFEKGFPAMHYDDASGQSKWDPIEDDTAIVAHVRGKGLVVLSGCAHSGIVNTVNYAREVTGIDKIFVVMGGFHLSGPDFEPVIAPTAQALKELDPAYIVPTHCTGRKAVMLLEKQMPEKFLLNMTGTNMVFAA